MRKLPGTLLVCLTAAALAVPSLSSAQSIYWGAGLTFPTGDYSDYAKTGYTGVAGVTFPVGPEALSILGEAFYGQNSHKDVDGDKTHPYGLMGGLLYDLSPGSVGGIYFFGQLGLMVHRYSSDEFDSDSESGLGFGLGGGYGFSLGDTELWAEGRFMRGNFDLGNTSYFGIVAGVSLALGGGN